MSLCLFYFVFDFSVFKFASFIPLGNQAHYLLLFSVVSTQSLSLSREFLISVTVFFNFKCSIWFLFPVALPIYTYMNIFIMLMLFNIFIIVALKSLSANSIISFTYEPTSFV